MKRPWTVREIKALRDSYSTMDTSQLATTLNRSVSSVYQQARKLGLSKDLNLIREHTRRHLSQSSKRHQFKKGQTPHNKGVKGWNADGRSLHTWFKKGNRPQTWKPIGYTRIDSDGYTYVKVGDGKGKHNFEPAHVHLWEQHHGPVPSGHVVVFKDGDKSHIVIDNLELVSRADLVQRNALNNQPYPDELKQVIRLIAGLSHRITTHYKRKGQGQRPCLKQSRT